MAFTNNATGAIPGLKAGADLSSSQFLAVVLDASGDVVVAGAGAASIGVLQNDPTLGQAAEVFAVGNTTKMVAGAAVVAGALITADAAGKAVVAGLNDYIYGETILSTGGADEILTFHITMPGRSP